MFGPALEGTAPSWHEHSPYWLAAGSAVVMGLLTWLAVIPWLRRMAISRFERCGEGAAICTLTRGASSRPVH